MLEREILRKTGLILPDFVSFSDSRKGKEVLAARRDPRSVKERRERGKPGLAAALGCQLGRARGKLGRARGEGPGGLGGPKSHHVSLLLFFLFFFFFKSFFQGSF